MLGVLELAIYFILNSLCFHLRGVIFFQIDLKLCEFMQLCINVLHHLIFNNLRFCGGIDLPFGNLCLPSNSLIVDVPEQLLFQSLVVVELVVIDNINIIVSVHIEITVLGLLSAAEEDEAVSSVLHQNLVR